MSIPIDPEDFLSVTSSYRGKQRVRTGTGNYVATVRKPTIVTHSCVGSFTGPSDSNLIICKGSLVEIYLIVENEIKPILDFPVVEKVVFMELSRRPQASVDYLFIATELYKFCVYSWNAASSKLITIKILRYLPPPKLAGGQWNYCQGGTICPRSKTCCRFILYASQDDFKVTKTVDFQTLEIDPIRVVGNFILDMKFLYGSGPPTVAALEKKRDGGAFRVRVFEISGDNIITLDWGLPTFIVKSTLLIPVHQSPYGFLIIGEENFSYINDSVIKAKRMGFFNIEAYGRFRTDDRKQSYLLGDHDGRLLMIELPELTHRLLGMTSKPSSISCISDTMIFVGSCSNDSQIIKIHHLADLEVLRTYTNSGPVSDFCVINKPGGRRKIVMCGGTLEKGVLEVFSTGTGIITECSVKAPKIINVWSLKSSAYDADHTYLVIQTLDFFISVYAAGANGFTHHPMNGFESGVVTLCCQRCNYRQFVQVTGKSVNLIDSKTGVLKHSWTPGFTVTCASATNMQILLGGGKLLVYVDVGDGKIIERKRLQLEYEVACLDISPLGQKNLYPSQLAAVATWGEHKVWIFSLPELNLLSEEQLSSLPRCILLCAFGEEWHVLCSSGDGTLYTFQLDKNNFQLHGKNLVSLGRTSNTLRQFTLDGEVCVFFSTEDVPSVICYRNKQLQYKPLNLTNVIDSCHFRRENFPDGLILVTLDGFVFCKLGEFAESGRIPIISYGRRICRQEETQTYAIITEEKQQQERKSNLLLLLDENLNTSSTFKLGLHEVGLTVINCQFGGNDVNHYYCVGTSFENQPNEGRILLFRARDGKLAFITAYVVDGPVHYIKNFDEGLLVSVSHGSPRFIEWRLTADGTRELYRDPNKVVEDAEEEYSRTCSLSQQIKYDLHDIVIAPENRNKQTANQMVENEVMFTSNARYFLRSYRGSGVNKEMVGQWYSGEFITQIKAGTLARLSDEDYAQVPSVLFLTTTGAIRVIVSLPSEVYKYLEDLEQTMRIELKQPTDVVGLMRKCVGIKHGEPKQFIDGDFLESFLSLTTEEQQKVAGKMKISDEKLKTLKTTLNYLALFH